MSELVCNTDVVLLFCGGHCTTLQNWCCICTGVLQQQLYNSAILIMLDMYWCVATITVQLCNTNHARLAAIAVQLCSTNHAWLVLACCSNHCTTLQYWCRRVVIPETDQRHWKGTIILSSSYASSSDFPIHVWLITCFLWNLSFF